MIGKILKNIRQVKGLTQQQLSEITNIPQNTLSQYETGKIEPTYDIISTIANKCGFKVQFVNGKIVLDNNNIKRKD